MFKLKYGNRPVDQVHVNRLITSMSEVYIPQPIYVNQKHEITDGQHRFQAAKALGLAITYMVTDHSLEDIRRMNQNAKNWTFDDFLESYVNIEKRRNPEEVGHYSTYKHFKRTSKFSNSVCLIMLIGDRTNKVINLFKTGKFIIPPGNFNKAKNYSSMIHEIAPYYEGYKRRSFIMAMLTLFDDELFDFKRFMKKLSINRNKLYHCTNQTDYVDTIERLYNWGSQNKVKFRRHND